MARARQGQHRWHRPEWGAPDRPQTTARRWHLPLFGVFLIAVGVWLWQHPDQVPDPLRRQIAAFTTDVTTAPEARGATRLVYRWRDGAGVVQFTDQPPPEGVAYVQVYVDPATNVVPAGTAPWPER